VQYPSKPPCMLVISQLDWVVCMESQCTYSSSQLYRERARVVSIWRTNSLCETLLAHPAASSQDINTNLKLILGSKLGSRMLPPSVTPSYSHLVSSSSTPVRQRQKGKPQTHASRSGSGILASTLLISDGPKPVKVRLCLGRLNPGPTGPWRSAMGAPTEGLRSRRGSVGSDDAMVDG
jgi:hypothetical protein